jgi:hypothetical protein
VMAGVRVVEAQPVLGTLLALVLLLQALVATATVPGTMVVVVVVAAIPPAAA